MNSSNRISFGFFYTIEIEIHFTYVTWRRTIRGITLKRGWTVGMPLSSGAFPRLSAEFKSKLHLSSNDVRKYLEHFEIIVLFQELSLAPYKEQKRATILEISTCKVGCSQHGTAKVSTHDNCFVCVANELHR